MYTAVSFICHSEQNYFRSLGFLQGSPFKTIYPARKHVFYNLVNSCWSMSVQIMQLHSFLKFHNGDSWIQQGSVACNTVRMINIFKEFMERGSLQRDYSQPDNKILWLFGFFKERIYCATTQEAYSWKCL